MGRWSGASALLPRPSFLHPLLTNIQRLVVGVVTIYQPPPDLLNVLTAYAQLLGQRRRRSALRQIQRTDSLHNKRPKCARRSGHLALTNNHNRIGRLLIATRFFRDDAQRREAVQLAIHIGFCSRKPPALEFYERCIPCPRLI